MISADSQQPGLTEQQTRSLRSAYLFGVELHLVLCLWEKLNIISSVNLLSDYADLISNRYLKYNSRYAHTLLVALEYNSTK